jgi:molybdate transport system ATP-binding protein
VLGVIAGLVLPEAGRVTLADEVWLDRARGLAVPVHQRRLAFVLQGLALFPHMSALGNVAYGMPEVARRDRRSRAQALLDRVGVGHLARRRPRTFSGGEAQRVALARALARSPRLMLLDEPFSALDRALRAQLAALVRELVAELGIPLIHVTHSVAEARLLADQVIRIERGEVVAAGPAADVLANAAILEE